MSVNQLFFSPYAVTRHELYHLLGCKQHFDMPACYREIASLKQRERQFRISGFFDRIGERPLYPTWNELTGDMLVSRAEKSIKWQTRKWPTRIGRKRMVRKPRWSLRRSQSQIPEVINSICPAARDRCSHCLRRAPGGQNVWKTAIPL